MTQRAKESQFIAARDYLEKAKQLFENFVICPGNHDIALFRVWERVLAPFALYRKYIHKDLDQVFRGKDVTVVALNSVRPLSRIVQGRLSSKQYTITSRAFRQSDEKRLHVLAFHHPLVTFSADDHYPGLDVSWDTISEGERVDVVLTGHRHDSDIKLLPAEGQKTAVLIISCGTSASKRGRGKDAGRNSFNVIEGTRSDLKVTTYYYDREAKSFQVSTVSNYDLTAKQ